MAAEDKTILIKIEVQEAQAKFKPYKKYFESRFMDIPTVDTDALYTYYA